MKKLGMVILGIVLGGMGIRMLSDGERAESEEHVGWHVRDIVGGYSAATYSATKRMGFVVMFRLGKCDKPFARIVAENSGVQNGQVYPLRFRVDEGTMWKVAPPAQLDDEVVILTWDAPPLFLEELLGGSAVRVEHNLGISAFDLSGSSSVIKQASERCVTETETAGSDASFFGTKEASTRKDW